MKWSEAFLLIVIWFLIGFAMSMALRGCLCICV
jgi:hypothetical protein